MPNESYLKCSCRNCGGHIEFSNEARGQTISCPHCSNQTDLFTNTEATNTNSIQEHKSPLRKLFWMLPAIGSLTIAGAMGWGFLAAKRSAQAVRPGTIPGEQQKVSGSIKPKANLATQETELPARNGLECSPIILQKKNDSRLLYAIGTIRNKTDRQRFGVKVEMDAFDERDKKLGSASDYIQVIEPGQDWNFIALLTDPKAVRATLTAIKEN
jgi:hypothetical protein